MENERKLEIAEIMYDYRHKTYTGLVLHLIKIKRYDLITGVYHHRNFLSVIKTAVCKAA